MAQPSMLPDVFADFRWKVAHVQVHRSSGALEWSSTCPTCADAGHTGNEPPDRCRWFMSGKIGPHGWCRRCKSVFVPGRVERNEDAITALKREMEEKAQAYEAGREEKVKQINTSLPYQQWHTGMPPEKVKYWQEQGIPPDWQRYYLLGWRDLHGGAFTIPYPCQSQEGILTVQYRLEHPNGAGRYIWETGTGAHPFWAKITADVDLPVLITEGAKKGMVATTCYYERKLDVAAIPNKTPGKAIVQALADRYKRAYICIDPDGYLPGPSRTRIIPAQEIASYFKEAYLVRLPGKLDDLIVRYHVDPSEILRVIARAERVK